MDRVFGSRKSAPGPGGCPLAHTRHMPAMQSVAHYNVQRHRCHALNKYQFYCWLHIGLCACKESNARLGRRHGSTRFQTHIITACYTDCESRTIDQQVTGRHQACPERPFGFGSTCCGRAARSSRKGACRAASSRLGGGFSQSR